MLTEKQGLYLHIPFCEQKCKYCDFYSFRASAQLYDEYTTVLCERIKAYGERFALSLNTIYVGGGTPTVLPALNLAKIITAAKQSFRFSGGEITVECNPADDLAETFKILKSVGVNRLSLGVQTSCERELKAIGRRHTNADVVRTVNDAREAGIDNISLDVMLGLPFQTMESLENTLDFVLSQGATHISAYILKIEEGTPLALADPEAICLPDEEKTAEFYEYTERRLRGAGFEHYEISNFAKKGFRSKHNMCYWKDGEYLGLGPSAHSFLDGKRFYFERDIKKFMTEDAPLFEGGGGDRNEYMMLRLRLSDGISFGEYKARFGEDCKFDRKKAAALKNAGLIEYDENRLRLTEKGFLLSNSVITELIF